MSSDRRPRSLEGIRRLAKTLKTQQGVSHRDALELAAKQAGYQNYTHARHQLEAVGSVANPRSFPKRPTRGPDEGHADFLASCRDAWVQTLDQFNPRLEDRRVWSGFGEIRAVLDGLLSHTRSHAHLPTGGGQDLTTVRTSAESGCLEFEVERGLVYIARPKTLILERVAAAPAQSFLLLELADLAPSGAYAPEDQADLDPSDAWLRRREEVVDLGAGDYVERSHWDAGNLGYDSDDREIPLPQDARLVVRWFNGKVLFVTKGSMWNGTSSTYDGRHDAMGPNDIRAMIERSLPKTLAAE